MDDTIFQDATRGNLESLRELPTARLHRFLRELIAQEEKATYMDDDTLEKIGTFVARSGHEGADEVMLAWLADAPTSSRLAVTTNLLSAYWLNIRHVPDLQKIERLLSVMGHFTPEDSGWRHTASTILLLCMKRSDLPADMRSYLRHKAGVFRDALAATDAWSFLAEHYTRVLTQPTR